MAIDVYPVPAEHKVYTRQNLFSANTTEAPKNSIGVNLYQYFTYTQANSKGYFAMTTGAAAVLNHWAELGVFCSYWFPKTQPIILSGVSEPTMNLGNYVYCGSMVSFVPWAEKIVHPRVALDLGLGTTKETQLTSCTSTGCTGGPKQVGYPFLIIKPAIYLDANVFSFMQWSGGIAYRVQISLYGSNRAQKFDGKASWFEFTTGPVFNLR